MSSDLPISSPYRSTPDAPVTETERDQLSSRLNAAYKAGTLDADDYRARLDTLFAAQRLGQLVPVVEGLPPLQTYADPAIVARPGGQPGEVSPARSATGVALIAVGGVLAAGGADRHPAGDPALDLALALVSRPATGSGRVEPLAGATAAAAPPLAPARGAVRADRRHRRGDRVRGDADPAADRRPRPPAGGLRHSDPRPTRPPRPTPRPRPTPTATAAAPRRLPPRRRRSLRHPRPATAAPRPARRRRPRRPPPGPSGPPPTSRRQSWSATRSTPSGSPVGLRVSRRARCPPAGAATSAT